VSLLLVAALALAGLLFSARAAARRPSASPVLLALLFFMTLITTIDYGIGVI
jgi:hypothetical protein